MLMSGWIRKREKLWCDMRMWDLRPAQLVAVTNRGWGASMCCVVPSATVWRGAVVATEASVFAVRIAQTADVTLQVGHLSNHYPNHKARAAGRISGLCIICQSNDRDI